TRRSSDLHHLGSDTSLADHPARTSVAAASGGGTAHDASRAVHGREERLLLECEQLVGFIRGNCTADDHGIIRHRSADEALLPREGRCCPFADDDHLRRYAVDLMRLARRAVVVIVDELLLGASDQVDDLACDPLSTHVRVPACKLHEVPVVVTERRIEWKQNLRFGPAVTPATALGESKEARCDGVAETARAEVHAHPD